MKRNWNQTERESYNLNWKHFDFVRNTIRITPEKRNKDTIFKISDNFITIPNNFPKRTEKRWRDKNVNHLDKVFRRMRQRTAHKLGNPRLNRITFHTLRYWRATMAYDYSKADLTYLKELLGHNNIENTRRYTRHCKTRHGDERFIVKVARKVKEASELLENGYYYVTGECKDGGKLFRKQKRLFLGSWSSDAGSWSSMD
ncbi:MAG: site-specific integrase [Candidatus Bathyarchaeota archaeon]|nr:site-specific integrase [Candidatus Bathyarchaeota archaeon]